MTTTTINPEKPPTIRPCRRRRNAKMTAGGQLPGGVTTAGDSSRRLLLDVGNSVGTLAGIRDAVFLGPEIKAALEDVGDDDQGDDDDLRRMGLFPSKKKRRRPLDE